MGGFSIGAWQAELIGVSFPNVDGIIPIGGMSAFVHPEAVKDVSTSIAKDCSQASYLHIFPAERRTHWALYAPNTEQDVADWWATNGYGDEPCGIWEHIAASTVVVDATGPAARPDLSVLVVIGDKDLILPPPNGHFQVARLLLRLDRRQPADHARLRPRRHAGEDRPDVPPAAPPVDGAPRPVGEAKTIPSRGTVAGGAARRPPSRPSHWPKARATPGPNRRSYSVQNAIITLGMSLG